MDIKDFKTQKRIIFFFLLIVVLFSLSFSSWFLYDNFYQTTTWKDDLGSSFDSKPAIQSVNLNKMRELIDSDQQKTPTSTREDLDIDINFR